MAIPEIDTRSLGRRIKDKEIAAEPTLMPLDVPPNAPLATIETKLRGNCRHPLAVEGIVENGLVRPLDQVANLPEQLRVIIVAWSAVGAQFTKFSGLPALVERLRQCDELENRA